MSDHKPFAVWLAREIALRGYDLDRRGEQTRFSRTAGISPAILSRLLRGAGDPDVKTCRAIAAALGYKTTHILAAAGLLLDGEEEALPPSPRPLTRRDHIVALVGDDVPAQKALIVLLDALGKRGPSD